MLPKKQLFTRGMLDISPHMLSVIPLGIICVAIIAAILALEKVRERDEER